MSLTCLHKEYRSILKCSVGPSGILAILSMMLASVCEMTRICVTPMVVDDDDGCDDDDNNDGCDDDDVCDDDGCDDDDTDK